MASPTLSSADDRRASKMVCVTGAGGFIGSWVVKLLLERGYTVRGTARDPEDPKNDHLRALHGASDRLILLKAELLDYPSLRRAFTGCGGVFHTATPMSKDLAQAEIGLEGTKNVVNAAAEAGVRRVVYTSSYAAAYLDPKRRPEAILDESCWSDLDYLRNTGNWYCYGKTMAELTGEEMAKERGLEWASVLPAVTMGPMLQPTLNASVNMLLWNINGKRKSYANKLVGISDVRDVAVAHLLVYENSSARGRYLCLTSVLCYEDLLHMLVALFPRYKIPPRSAEDQTGANLKPYPCYCRRLRALGLRFTPLQQTLYDTMASAKEKGHLLPPPSPSTVYRRSSI